MDKIQTISGSQYIPYLLELLGSNVSLILDVGSNDGGTSSVFQRLFPKAFIHAFEPDPRAIANCYKRIDIGNIDRERFQLHEVAVSDFIGESSFYQSFGKNPNMEWYVSGWDLAGSLNKPLGSRHPQEDWLNFGEPIEVRVITLDSWFADWPIHKIDLCHMDVQSGELSAIRGGREVMFRSRFIYLECEHIIRYSNQPTLAEIATELNNHSLICQFDDGNFLFANNSYR